MQVIGEKKLFLLAKGFSKENREWHWHLLGPWCVFNSHKDNFAIALEDHLEGKSYICLFKRKPKKQAKTLADMVYGKGFLAKVGEGKHNPRFNAILKRAKELSSMGVEWHHHHLLPECIFNKKRGKNCIIVEDPVMNKILIAVYNGNPMKDLTKLERLFYAQ
ncbi:MAG: hypothetical protein KGI00_03825 [Candidatus Micrarchaeota archaeon]|nr:hypothetical protein [Candidatus Micrarchaeota archaeon]MDE1849829.1 hypothetical protein [Candidatus Micrarchaeota archaeon]